MATTRIIGIGPEDYVETPQRFEDPGIRNHGRSADGPDGVQTGRAAFFDLVPDFSAARLDHYPLVLEAQKRLLLGGLEKAGLPPSLPTPAPALSLPDKPSIAVLPFQNTLSTFNIPGSAIVAALENGVSQVEEGGGRFPQVAGLRFTWDPSVAPGQGRISSVEVQEGDAWVPIDPVDPRTASCFMTRAATPSRHATYRAISPCGVPGGCRWKSC